MTVPAEARATAARLVHRVTGRRQTSDQALGTSTPDPLVRELFYGALRHHFSLNARVDALLDRPVRAKDLEIKALMVVGAYQLIHMRIPDHAAIHETVAACPLLSRPWSKGLVNGILREISRQPVEPVSEQSLEQLAGKRVTAAQKHALESAYEHPAWMLALLAREYRDGAAALLHANNSRAPMCLRINVTRTDPASYQRRLTEAGIAYRRPRPELPDVASTALDDTAGDALAASPAPDFGPETLILDEPVSTASLPGFRQGEVAVQDAGAQLVAQLLAPAPGDRVLDACVAPGGKLFHLMERNPDAQFTALDSSADRMTFLRSEAERLHHQRATLLCGDATARDWWDGDPFQWILLDAPCSGSGTLRRHPDIKLLREPDQLTEYQHLQLRMLANLWQLLRPGGTLLYCTCSIFTAENDSVIGKFLRQQPDALPSPLRLATGRPTRHGWQLLPFADTDGFYFARLDKPV